MGVHPFARRYLYNTFGQKIEHIEIGSIAIAAGVKVLFDFAEFIVISDWTRLPQQVNRPQEGAIAAPPLLRPRRLTWLHLG